MFRPEQELRPVVTAENFNWRAYCQSPEQLSEKGVELMDQLVELLREDDELAEPFFSAFEEYRAPLVMLVNWFRGELTPEERQNLLKEIEQAGKARP